MQMFFLKNLVGVSTAALLFAGISLSTMADQEFTTSEQPKQPEENLLAAMPEHAELEHGHIPPEEAVAIAATVPNEDLHVELYEKEMEIEADPLASTQSSLKSPEERVEQRLEALNNANGEMDMMNTAIDSSDSSQSTLSEAPPLVTEGQAHMPDNASDHSDQLPGVTNNSIEGEVITPIASPMHAKIIKPKLVAWDDEDSRPKPKKEDAGDPTSEGTGPHGKHKGGPKVTDPRMIPIIRMGENLTQDNGFAIIKSWDN